MSGRLLRWLGLAAAMLLLAACSRPPQALQQEAYVWQRRWMPPVKEALAESAPLLGGWRVLAAEIDREGRLWPIPVDFAALAASGRPVIAVIRVEKTLEGKSADQLADQVFTVVESWRRAPVKLNGIEIDHDASLRALEAYGRFLQGVRRRLDPALALSITMLPAWLENRQAFKDVLAPVDEAVLQLHALDHPSRQLFDAGYAKHWIKAFAQYSRKPFRIALPNYGSRVSFDEKGRIVAVQSEGPAVPQDGPSRELYVPPKAMVDFLRDLERNPPGNLQGIVWFRLPVATDRRCWSRSTWHAVLGRQSLETRLSVEVGPADEQGWQNLTLINEGAIDAEYPATVEVAIPCSSSSAAYRAEGKVDSTNWLRQDKGLLRATEKLVVGRMRCPGQAQVHIRW